MDNQNSLDEKFGPATEQWQEWLQQYHLTGPIVFLLDIMAPLAMLSAQFLYVARPALGLFMAGETVQQWAELLETPGGVDWLKSRLVMDMSDE